MMPVRPLPFHPAAGATIGAAWPIEAVLALFDLPFNDLLFRAQQVHRQHFDANQVELATLLSIKPGGCRYRFTGW
jgi:biotin synthase